MRVSTGSTSAALLLLIALLLSAAAASSVPAPVSSISAANGGGDDHSTKRSLRLSHLVANTTTQRQTAAGTTKTSSEAERMHSVLSPHIHSMALRPTSTLLFADELSRNTNGNYFADSENGSAAGQPHRALLLEQRYHGTHGVYGALRQLTPPPIDNGDINHGSSADGAESSSKLREKIDRHNELLRRFNSERHLSRFERLERAAAAAAAAARVSRGDSNNNVGSRRLQEDNDAAEPKESDPAAAGQNVDEAAEDITLASVETLYEGVLPVVVPPEEEAKPPKDETTTTTTPPAAVEGQQSDCSANPQCVAQGLTGQCCPTSAGPYLACCPQSETEEAAMAATAVAAKEEEKAKKGEEGGKDDGPTFPGHLPPPEVIPPQPGSDAVPPTVPPPAPVDEKNEEDKDEEEGEEYHAPDPIIDSSNADTEAMAAATAAAEAFDGTDAFDVDAAEDSIDPTDSMPIPVDSESLHGGLLNSYQTAPLGQGYGTHYAHVWVGSPTPQRQSVIVDTGSHHTAFPCKECAKCGEEHHTDHYFDWSKSKTFHPLNCGQCEPGARCSGGKCIFSQSYTEGSSWKAYQVKDQFFCGGNEADASNNPVDRSYAIEFTFGCQTSETGLFITQLADGIMGMADDDATLTKRMHDAKKIEHKMFAMCFRRELQQSKEGVTAGVLTMGGVDTRLHSSPMVYARNTVNRGWFTVYVRSVYIRSNGGQNSKPDSSDQHVTKLNINLSQVNSGKGVIVDSGTTDTYFHRGLKGPFEQEFKTISGRQHSNRAIKLTKEELHALPTLLIQLDAFKDQLDPALGSPDSISGLVGSEIDPERPADVLLAIPATHYMEYDPKADAYTSRLYFSEGSGGVLGANAMMGHDILFDSENGRVGFAESSCEYYADVAEVGEDGEVEDEAGVEADCILGVPSLSEECMDSIDTSVCHGNGSTKVTGKEKWTMVVESPGTKDGVSCEEIILRDYAEDIHEEHEHPEPPIAFCDGNGLCFKERVCQMTCADVMDEEKEPPSPEIPGGGDGDDDGTDDDFFSDFQPCGDNLWGACEPTCKQEKIVSVLMTDGVCHEDKKMRKRRPCHIDACGRSDPCRVPFVVHAVLGFRGANAQFWSKTAEDEFMEAFSLAIDFNNEKGDELVGPGDVKVLMASPWFENDDPTRRALGMKMVLEISVYNAKAKLPRGYHYDPITEEQAEAFELNAASHEPNAADAVFNIIDNVENVWKEWTRPLSTCEESDIEPLGKTALDIHVELERPLFVNELLSLLKQLNAVSRYASPFAPIFREMAFAENSKVLTSWTIKTEIDGGTVHDHPISSLKGIGRGNIMAYITNVPFMTLVLGLLFIVCCCGVCCGARCCARRGYENKQIAALLEEVERRKAEKARGKYSQVGLNGNASYEYSDDDSEDEIQFSGNGYRDDESYDDEGGSHDGDLELAEMPNGDDKHDLEELEAMDNGGSGLNGLKAELS